MTKAPKGLASRLDAALSVRWESGRDLLPGFLRVIGLTGEEHNKALYIFPRPTDDIATSIDKVRVATADEGAWFFLGGESSGKKRLVAWPVAPGLDPTKALGFVDATCVSSLGDPQFAHMALAEPIHGRQIATMPTVTRHP